MQYTRIYFSYKNEKFVIKVDILTLLPKNIDCWYTLELSQRFSRVPKTYILYQK